MKRAVKLSILENVDEAGAEKKENEKKTHLFDG